MNKMLLDPKTVTDIQNASDAEWRIMLYGNIENMRQESENTTNAFKEEIKSIKIHQKNQEEQIKSVSKRTDRIVTNIKGILMGVGLLGLLAATVLKLGGVI